LFFTPLRERFALVTPPFREKASDEENLAILPHRTIPSDQFPVDACQFERIQATHG
jgi:hypothetical protein